MSQPPYRASFQGIFQRILSCNRNLPLPVVRLVERERFMEVGGSACESLRTTSLTTGSGKLPQFFPLQLPLCRCHYESSIVTLMSMY